MLKQSKELKKILEDAKTELNEAFNKNKFETFYHCKGDAKDDSSILIFGLYDYEICSLTYSTTVGEFKKVKNLADITLSLWIPIHILNFRALQISHILHCVIPLYWEPKDVFYYDKDKNEIHTGESAEDKYESVLLKRYNASKCTVCDKPTINELMGENNICLSCQKFLKENKSWH